VNQTVTVSPSNLHLDDPKLITMVSEQSIKCVDSIRGSSVEVDEIDPVRIERRGK